MARFIILLPAEEAGGGSVRLMETTVLSSGTLLGFLALTAAQRGISDTTRMRS